MTGGTLTVYDSGVAFTTFLCDGSMVVFGRASSTTISGGEMTVTQSGTEIGTVTNTHVIGGKMTVEGAATANSTTLHSGGSLLVSNYAKVSNTVVNGEMTLSFSGMATVTTVGVSGKMTVENGTATRTTVFGEMGLLEGRNACCYPGLEDSLIGATPTTDEVTVDGHFITSRGMGTAIPFGLEIIKCFQGREAARDMAERIVYGV